MGFSWNWCDGWWRENLEHLVIELLRIFWRNRNSLGTRRNDFIGGKRRAALSSAYISRFFFTKEKTTENDLDSVFFSHFKQNRLDKTRTILEFIFMLEFPLCGVVHVPFWKCSRIFCPFSKRISMNHTGQCYCSTFKPSNLPFFQIHRREEDGDASDFGSKCSLWRNATVLRELQRQQVSLCTQILKLYSICMYQLLRLINRLVADCENPGKMMKNPCCQILGPLLLVLV